MTARVNKRTSAKQAVDQVRARELAQELAQAEQRGAARVRDQLRSVVEERRRVVRVRDQQVEVVETSALDEIIEGQ